MRPFLKMLGTTLGMTGSVCPSQSSPTKYPNNPLFISLLFNIGLLPLLGKNTSTHNSKNYCCTKTHNFSETVGILETSSGYQFVPHSCEVLQRECDRLVTSGRPRGCTSLPNQRIDVPVVFMYRQCTLGNKCENLN